METLKWNMMHNTISLYHDKRDSSFKKAENGKGKKEMLQ